MFLHEIVFTSNNNSLHKCFVFFGSLVPALSSYSRRKTHDELKVAVGGAYDRAAPTTARRLRQRGAYASAARQRGVKICNWSSVIIYQ